MSNNIMIPYRGLSMSVDSGISFFPLDPTPEEINIEDIAAPLAKTCRYNGQTKNKFYSVAEHSVLVSYMVPKNLAFQGLMHDATEAYTGDLIRAIKYTPEVLDVIKPIEDKIWFAIAKRFNLPSRLHPKVKECDKKAVDIEKRDILGIKYLTKSYSKNFTVQGLEWREAKILFMERFNELYKGK